MRTQLSTSPVSLHDPPAGAATAELTRIQRAYAHRFDRRRDPHNFCGPMSVCHNQEVEREFIGMLRRFGSTPLEDKIILDVGTAGGFFLRGLLKYGARAGNLFGVDLWHDLMAEGHRFVPSIGLVCSDARSMPFPDGMFDIVLQTTMLSSVVDPAVRDAIAREMLRKLKPGGLLLSYDFRFKRPGDRDVCTITRRELSRMFRGCRITVRACSLLPQVGRVLARRSERLYQLASVLSPLKTHYWAAIQKAKICAA